MTERRGPGPGPVFCGSVDDIQEMIHRQLKFLPRKTQLELQGLAAMRALYGGARLVWFRGVRYELVERVDVPDVRPVSGLVCVAATAFQAQGLSEAIAEQRRSAKDR